MTLQSVFNRAYEAHVLLGKPKSISGIGKCRYRAHDQPDKRCAIGWNIRDEDYNIKLEGFSACSPTIASLFKGISPGALENLQMAHDYTFGDNFRSSVERQYRNFANKYSLRIPVRRKK